MLESKKKILLVPDSMLYLLCPESIQSLLGWDQFSNAGKAAWNLSRGYFREYCWVNQPAVRVGVDLSPLCSGIGRVPTEYCSNLAFHD